MRVKHRFTFPKDKDSKTIEEYLNSKNISYKLFNGIQVITLEIFEDNNFWQEVADLMSKHNILSLKECSYTKEEYDNAEWFTIRSKWRWEYPQPEDDSAYIHLTYDSSNYCNKCGSGLVQKDSFKIKKSPNWGKRNFLMLNWVEDELFINSEVEAALLKYNLKGLKLYDVKKIKTNEPIDNIKQIYVNDILKPGLVNKNDTILSESKCGNCGCKKMIITGRGVIFKKEVFEDIENDIVKSYEVFGDGLICARMIFVSKRFYDAMSESKLCRDLVFEPVMLI